MEGRAPFMIQNVLAATLAAYLNKVKPAAIKERLMSFVPGYGTTPGRLNRVQVRGIEVLIDFAHNPAGFQALAAKHWRTGRMEMERSLSRELFARACRRLVPEIQAEDLIPAPAGIRAQAVSRAGDLIDDFLVLHGERAVHVLNAPSPAATASLAIGAEIAGQVISRKLR